MRGTRVALTLCAGFSLTVIARFAELNEQAIGIGLGLLWIAAALWVLGPGPWQEPQTALDRS